MSKSLEGIKRVAVIGAGACGLAAAKYLLAEEHFDQIDILEQRDHVGGVWNYTTAAEKDRLTSEIPQENPNLPLEEPIWRSADTRNSDGHLSREATFLSPLYDGLETNIPRNLMRFSDLPFPDGTQLFPKFETVLGYLEKYSEDVKHLIQFHVQVLDVRLDGGSWAVTRKDLKSEVVRTDKYDAVVAASGHYNVPYVPSIDGMTTWHQAYPGSIRHSKYYTSPNVYKGRKVVVVGNSASGIDIGLQISKVCRTPLLLSSRSESYFATGNDSNTREYPPIAEFLSPKTHNRAVRFENGVIEEDIDAIVFCTGYLYSFPFLSSLQPPVIADGSRTLHVYQQLFYTEQPTLVFPVLTQKVIPFPTAEAQSAVFARVWSGRLSLPSKEEMNAWEESTVATRGSGKSFHVMVFPADADYINYMHDWAASAEPRPGLANKGHGKEAPCWGEKEKWTRQRFKEIKQAFAMQGEHRHHIQHMEELGFDFEAWKEKESHSSTI
ncbi:hypothetical protein VTO42DRAFT_6785 [Malbranchea cinnamomea]